METVDNEVLQALSARKSVRVYTDDPVTEAERNAILQAAFQAPTAGNQQLYTILNITDPALKARLADLCDHQPFIAKAPLVLVFLADCRRWLQAYKAAGIGMSGPPVQEICCWPWPIPASPPQNAVVAAESLGIGSCYIGDVIENAEQMQEALHMPEYVVPACMLVFGRPTEQQKARPQACPLCQGGHRLREYLPRPHRCGIARGLYHPCRRQRPAELRFHHRHPGLLQTQVRERFLPGNDEECRGISGRVPKVK